MEFTEEDIQNFMQTEEYEQLDELSKNLVHRYYGKAIRRHRAVLDKDIDIADEHQKIKRLMAKTNKGAQLGSRNKNPIHHPEVQKHLKAASDAVAKMREPAQKEMAKREKGIDKAYSKLNSGKDRDGNKVVKATGKLTNKRMYGEESEQLDELSRGTLTSYATSAGQSLGGAVATIGKAKEISKFYAKKTSPEEDKKDAIQRDGKRMVGLGRAASRLNKEEVEQVDEREMTGGEMKKREKIVKSMKKGMQGFKDRYGDKAKDVMYATATKQAMKD